MAECIICGGTGGGELMTPVWIKSATPPTNTNILWIDSDPDEGGLKCYNAATEEWVHIPVAYA